MKIGIIGTDTCIRGKMIKEMIFRFKTKYGKDIKIASGGNKAGIEFDVKKATLALELEYVEFNPAFTGMNEYSYMQENYYNKGQHLSHYFHRYWLMTLWADIIIIGHDPESQYWKTYLDVFKAAEKKDIKTVFI